eukprot:11939161-Alexandrium_andersonii.AAC.1
MAGRIQDGGDDVANRARDPPSSTLAADMKLQPTERLDGSVRPPHENGAFAVAQVNRKPSGMGDCENGD